MAIRISPGLARAWMSAYGFEPLMRGGYIDIYSGPQPASAGDAPTGTKLGRITTNGDTFAFGTTVGGLFFSVGTFGTLTKVGNWVLIGSATGTAGWWRWKWNGDVRDEDQQSTYFPRIDGTVGESLFLPTYNITPSTVVSLDSFSLSFL